MEKKINISRKMKYLEYGHSNKGFFGTFWKQRYLMILLLPPIAWLIIFRYMPMYGVVMAFQKFNPVKGFFDSPWVGLKHFKEMFFDPDFMSSLKNGLIISVLQLVASFPVPIIFALLLNELKLLKLKKTIQTLTYLPHFVSWVFVASFIITFLSPSSGVFNSLLLSLGVIKEPIVFMAESQYFRSIVVISHIWKGFGFGSIIYLAAISSVDMQLYEAAIIDGATKLKRVWYITLPSILPTIMILLILSISGLLTTSFEQMFLLNNPLTLSVGEVIETYTYKVGLQLGRFAYGAAVGLFKSVVAVILLLSANFLSRVATRESLL